LLIILLVVGLYTRYRHYAIWFSLCLLR